MTAKKLERKKVIRREDIAGQVFSRFTVISFVDTGTKSAQWLCQCECGEKRVVYACNLKSGISRSCGCLFAKKTKPRASSIEARKRAYRAKHRDEDMGGSLDITQAEWNELP